MPKLIQCSWGERGQSLVFNKAHFRSSAILSICCGKAGMQHQNGESRCTEKVGLIPFSCRHVKSSRPLICTYKNAENAKENACFAGYTLPIITAVYICQFQHSFFITALGTRGNSLAKSCRPKAGETSVRSEVSEGPNVSSLWWRTPMVSLCLIQILYLITDWLFKNVFLPATAVGQKRSREMNRFFQ